MILRIILTKIINTFQYEEANTIDKGGYNGCRTQPCLVTNLVMNMVTNLVITKFGDELCDIFVTSFGDSLNWVMIFVTFLSLNLVGHQFE